MSKQKPTPYVCTRCNGLATWKDQFGYTVTCPTCAGVGSVMKAQIAGNQGAWVWVPYAEGEGDE